MKYIRDNIAAMEGYVPGEQPRDRRYIKLNTNENPYPPSPRVAAELARLGADCLRLYPDPGCLALREEAARMVALPGADWALAGNGSDDLLTIAVRTFVDQGGVLASPDPSYSLYPILADIQGATCRMIPLTADFGLPADILDQAAGASMLFIARPNAPTGNAFPMAEIQELCRGFDGIVWLDEAYADFADDTCIGLVTDYPNVVVSRTLSKSYSLAGVRLGLAFAQPALISQMLKVKDSYNVNQMTQVAALAAIRDQEYMRGSVARVRATRDQVSRQLTDLGFDVLNSQSNFLFCRPPIAAAELFAALRDQGILVRYFSGERTRDYVRITVGTPDEMGALIEAVKSLLGKR